VEESGKHIVVLGAGLVGKAMAIDLRHSGHRITAVDRNEEVLEELQRLHGVRPVRGDFTDARLEEWIRGADLVIGATPGDFGYSVMERVIRAGKNMVDISFCPENYLELDPLARENGVTVVADMGVAPGMCNAILGYHQGRMNVESYSCLVGGLPFSREWPLEYKSSWSPMDCIEEYVRPARFRVEGEEVIRPALSDVEPVEFDRVGTLEAWNSDGLRSLLDSFPDIPNMVEKTLRYPGTVEYLRVLRELGYFSKDPVEVEGLPVRPLDVTAALLFPRFRLADGEGEFTVMRVIIEGTEERDGATRTLRKRYQYDLFDTYNRSTDTTSMARTTGYACTGVAGLLLEGAFRQRGVIPPERVAVEEEHFQALLDHLQKRGVTYRLRNGTSG